MKKTVKIRKAKKGETPGYINKTKQFLKKAQTGMSVDNNGEQQQLMQQMFTTAYNSLMNDAPADVVYYDIIRDYGVDANTAGMIIQGAYQQLVKEGYINPEEMQNQTGEQAAEEGQPTQQGLSEEEMLEQQDEEELAMSEMDEDNSHIYNYANEDSFDEQSMQEQAFKFGGSNPPFKKYTLKIGNINVSVPAFDFKRLKDKWASLNNSEKIAALAGTAGGSALVDKLRSEQDKQEEETGLGYQNNRKVNANFGYGGFYDEGGSTQDPILNQYDRAGQMDEPNFSLDKMIQNQAGVQLFNPQGTNISSYLPDYNSIASWNNENWLAKKGGAVPELPKADMGLITKPFSGLKKGYDWYNKLPQFQNVSTLGKIAPAFTALGYGLHKTPGLNWLTGMKKGPQQDSYLSQNIIGLQNLTQGTSTGNELFSKNLSNPEELNVDRLVFATEDLQNIITKGNTEGRSSFNLDDVVEGEGTIGGIYPGKSKISMGQDDAGNKFFDISTSYKPGDPTSYFTIASDAKPVKFRNRFYYKPSESGVFEIFDGMGEPLVTGMNNMFKVTRPLVPSLSRTLGESLFSKASSTLGSSYPLGISTGPGLRTSGFPRSLISRQEVTSIPPKAWGDLSAKNQIGRGIEQLGYQYGTFPFGAISSMLGYNPLRTRGKNIIDISEPTLSYGNTSKNITAPLDDVNVAEDIMNNTNYFRRKGRNASLLGGLGAYLGYKGYDAMYGEPDAEPLGPLRNLLPRTQPQEFPMNDPFQLQLPDSLNGINNDYVNSRIFNRNRYNTLDNMDWDTIPENQKEGGKVSKRKFSKQFLSFYEEGGANPNDPNTIGKGNRMDTGTREVGKIVPNFVGNLKEGSNKATTGEIYELAKGNPEIMQTLMSDGQLKENLAEDQGQQIQAAKYGINMDDYINYFNNMETQSGGFVNMNSENPLTRFISGGMESESYEPYDIPQAHEGMEQNCPPGHVYNPTYGSCIPMMQYHPHYQRGRTTRGGLFNNLAPWNQSIGRGMPWTQQTSLPYFTNTGDGYIGELGPMVMKDVHKSTLFGRRPKKWTEYYDPSGKGITPEMLELMQNNQSDGRRKRRDRGENDNMIDNISDAATNLVQDASEGIKDFKQSRKDRRYSKYLGDKYGEDYWADEDRRHAPNQTYDPYVADSATPYGIPGPKSQKQLDKLYAREDKERFRDARSIQRQEDRDINSLTREKEREINRSDRQEARRLKKLRRNLNTQQLGGYLPQARFGAFDSNTGFGVGMGDKSSAYNQFSPQTEFENELSGGDTWGANNQNLNPFSFITPTGTGSYAETRNTGATLNQQAQNVIPQKETPCANATEEELMDPTSECYNPGLIGVDKESKRMRPVDFQAGLNVFNNVIARPIAGYLDKNKNANSNKTYMMGKMSTEANASTTTGRNKGNYIATMGPQHGAFRFDQTGQDASGVSSDVSQFGGYIMGQGGTHKMYNGLNMRNSDHKHYEQDEVTYMTQEELDNYLAAGGQVEYLY